MLPPRRRASHPSPSAQQRGCDRVFRRLIPILAAIALLLAACGQGAPSTPALDAHQIITKGFEATSKLTSFHLDLALNGDVSVPQMGSVHLTDSTLTGDFDLAKKLAHLSFSVPKLFSLTGEVVVTEPAIYVKTTLTGVKWQKQDNAAGGSILQVQDPTKALAEIESFLTRDGVETKKLADVTCGDSTCYQVEVTVPSALLDGAAASASAGTSASGLIGDALVLDLQFDTKSLYLTTVSTSIDNAQAATFSATLSLSAFDQPVTVSVPPDSEVGTGGGGFTFP